MVFEEKLSHFPARALEWFGAAKLTTWGIEVLFHPSALSTSTAMDTLTHMATPVTWGLGAFTVGIVRLIALYVNGNHVRTPLVRLITSFASIFVWFWVSVGLLKSGVPTTGLAIYPWLVIADMYSAYRAGSDVVQAEAQYRLKLVREVRRHASVANSQ
jgi:hypothetical protein